VPDLVAVLSEPNRRRLIELLSGGEQSVNQLAAQFGVTRSAVSQHLGVLSSAGLVQARQSGRFRYYRLDPDGMAALRNALEVFWNHELEQLANARPTIEGEHSMTAEKSVLVPLDADATFALLTEPERLRRWQAVTARVELRAGGEYRWTIVPGHTASGTITEVEPGKRLVFTFGWEDSDSTPAPGGSTVTITLEPAEGGTNVRLVHTGLTPEEAVGHLEGWTHYAERLARAAADGDAGPDEWGTSEPTDPLTAAEASLAVCQLVLRHLGPDDASAPTPCSNYTVDDLVEHLLGSIRSLGGAAGATVPDSGGSAESRVADAAQVALEAWRKRGLDGTVRLGPSELPATLATDILLIELLVHAWDFARATGQSIRVDDALSGYVLEHARSVIAPHMRDGDRFGAERETGPDADNLARLAAFTGRDI
jgi:uncharacterized protein (TIGR03086 family)